MMNYLENSKQYTGTELENTFFIPMLTGASAEELGVRVLYNMPVPAYITTWKNDRNILQKYSNSGWSASDHPSKESKLLDLNRVKAEMSFSASDYFSMVYEKLVSQASINLQDLSGTDLEKVETDLFREALSENIRLTMWLGDASKLSGYNTFTGFLPLIFKEGSQTTSSTYLASDLQNLSFSVELFDKVWTQAPVALKSLKPQGNLAYFVTSDVYELFEKHLDSLGVEAAFTGMTEGRPQLSYHGIPVIDCQVTHLLSAAGLPESFCILTDRRNLVLAVNTADMPGNEIRMWYNPDEMENRQRAVFLAGCTLLEEELISVANI